MKTKVITSLALLIILITIGCEKKTITKEVIKIQEVYLIDTLIQIDTLLLEGDTVIKTDTLFNVSDTIQATWREVVRKDHFFGADNFRMHFRDGNKNLFVNFKNCYPRPCMVNVWIPTQQNFVSYTYQDGSNTYNQIDTLNSWINVESYVYTQSVNMQGKLIFYPPIGASYNKREVYFDYSGSIVEL